MTSEMREMEGREADSFAEFVENVIQELWEEGLDDLLRRKR